MSLFVLPHLFLLTFREKKSSMGLTGSRITLTDRLKLMEFVLSDDVINLYRESQATMTRAQLDSRNSSERQPAFVQAVVVGEICVYFNCLMSGFLCPACDTLMVGSYLVYRRRLCGREHVSGLGETLP